MGEEDKQIKPDISAETLSRLEAIEKDIAAMAGMRKKQLWINIGGAVAVLVILLAFLGNLFDFARTYDTGTLLTELQSQGEEIIRSPQTQETLRQMQAEFVPLYRESLIKEFNNRAPELRKNALNVASNLEKYVKNDIKNRLEKDLTTAMDSMAKELTKRYPGLDLTQEQIEEVFNHGHARFIDETTRHVQTRLDGAVQELAILQAKFGQFKTDQEYLELKDVPTDEVSCRLIESMLELWIYNMNPAKGNRLASVDGGKK